MKMKIFQEKDQSQNVKQKDKKEQVAQSVDINNKCNIQYCKWIYCI